MTNIQDKSTTFLQAIKKKAIMSSLRERVDDKDKDDVDMVVVATEVMKYGNDNDSKMMSMLQNKNNS